MNTNYSQQQERLEALVAEQLNRDHIDVPLLPEVAGKVVRLTQDPSSDAAELSKLIQSDQTLAGHVMRVANSALYSPNSSLMSLQQAIARLGMKLISEIALAASINSTLFNTPGFEQHIHNEIRCSLISGLWAKEIARACRRNVEAAFITGLLHDIGRPVAVQAALKAAAELNIQPSNSTVLALEEKFQRPIGVCVVQQWEMPSIVINVVRHFDNYHRAGRDQNQTMIAVAGAEFANYFMDEQEGQHAMSREQLVESTVLAELNLYQDEVLELLKKEDLVKSAMEAMIA